MSDLKCLFILANGFEDSEAITTIDILRRANINVTLATLNDTLNVTTSHNIIVLAETYLDKVNASDFDFLVIPGGKAVFEVLNKCDKISTLILEFYNSNKLIAAICAAPLLIGKLGLFKGLKYTCFPGCDTLVKEGYNTNEEVEVEDKFITGKSMYYSADFALEIVKKVKGINEYKRLKDEVTGNINK